MSESNLEGQKFADEEDLYHSEPSSQQPKSDAMGIHISGANSNKSCVICCSVGDRHITIDHCFAKIGPTAGKSSDDRLVSIYELTRPALIALDSPLTLPPCIACQRPKCPGQSHCDDIELAYLFALEQRYPQKPGKKPVNPQIHRTWDIARRKWPQFDDLDPTFTLNQLPLVHRGIIVGKRLQNLAEHKTQLQETNVLYGLMAIRTLLGMDKLRVHQFRSFELGAEIREEIVDSCFSLLNIRCDHQLYDSLWQSLEIFLAMFTALTASLKVAQDRSVRGGRQNSPIHVEDYGGVLLPAPYGQDLGEATAPRS